MLKQNQFNSDPSRECTRSPRPMHSSKSPVARFFTYCGGNSPKRSLPALKMSATRASGVCCARVVAALASKANRTREMLEIRVIAVLHHSTGPLLRITGRQSRMATENTPSPDRVLCHEHRPSIRRSPCDRDEGGPFEVGNHGLISSRCKLLRSNAAGGERCSQRLDRKSRPARLVEASASEPSMKCRNRISCHDRPGPPGPSPGISSGDGMIPTEWHPACRRREDQSGFCTERENLAGDGKGKGTSGPNREAESTDEPARGGLLRSSKEAGVMPWSEGGRSPTLGASQLTTGGAPILNGRRQPSRGGTSRMTRECQVRICERLGVKFPGPTRQ